MSPFGSFELNGFLAQAYAHAFGLHGDLQIDREAFRAHLSSIIQKRLGTSPAAGEVLRFAQALFTDDLYLAAACARASPRAWQRFQELYADYVRRVVQSLRLPGGQAAELADSLPGHLFCHDQSGHSRIASYDGRSPLARWLAAILHNQAVREQQRKVNNLERIEDCADIPDWTGLQRLEARLRASRYRAVIGKALQDAAGALTDCERLLLQLRFEEAVPVRDIASLFGVHSSTITRQIQAAQDRLRQATVKALAQGHGLGATALEECLADLLENPEYSLLALLKAQ